MEKAKILVNRYLIGDYFLLSIRTKISRNACPGNFVDIFIGDHGEKKSFMIGDVDKKESSVKVIYSAIDKDIVGFLKQKVCGDVLRVAGPFGDCISVPKNSQNILLVANGRQMPAIAFLAKKLKGKKVFSVITGTEQEVIFSENLLLHFNSKVYVVKDSGKYQQEEKNQLFFQTIRKIFSEKINFVVSVGPEAMVGAIEKMAKKRSVGFTGLVEQTNNRGNAISILSGSQKIILATNSKERIEAFTADLGFDFVSEESGLDESIRGLPQKPLDIAIFLARAKAEYVAKNYQKGIVAGFNSVFAFKNKPLERPKNSIEAYNLLKLISGRKTVLYTGVFVKNIITSEEKWRIISTKIEMRKYSEDEIKKYLDENGEECLSSFWGFDPSGEYSSTFIHKINGSYNALLKGMPSEVLVELLAEAGFKKI